MKEHEVKMVQVLETSIFKNTSVSYDAMYFYCDEAEELYADEFQMHENDRAMKDAYRAQKGLLTSEEIVMIRKKYDIKQTDLCILLGWGAKTITRYEGSQVQDKAHDNILRKIAADPEWFLCLLKDAKNELPLASYQKYFKRAACLYEKSEDLYMRKALEARYIRNKSSI